ncbi:ABC transporter substrate-binding protein [Treponema sp.]|uniref:ABC transporter substrate-binding protein n=1 Tax=Treponema sp. TaxID=166 RepID=UPI00388D1C69
MKQKFSFIFLTAFVLLSGAFLSCAKKIQKQSLPELEGLTYSHTLETKYAKAFRADFYGESAILLTVSDSDRYLLVPESQEVSQNLPADIKIINYPVQNTYLAATSAMSFFARLNSLDLLKFSSIKKKDWYIDDAVTAMQNGSIIYAGKYNAPDFELLIDKKCPLAIESTMIYHSPQISEKLEALGITVFVDKSSYEEHPLGRLEWIKVYGLLSGKLPEAEDFFDKQIQSLPDKKNKSTHSRPLAAFFYVTPSGMVVIRGSDDYIVKMMEMAGASYVFSDIKKSRSPSIQISIEQFYAKAAEADILIYNSSIDNTIRSKQDLIIKNPLFADFKAVKTNKVWVTGSYIYQATDKIGEIILDLQNIMEDKTDELEFLKNLE